MTTIIVNNSICQIKDIPKEVDAKLKIELRYLNQSVSYIYHNNNKRIAKLRSYLEDNRFSGDRQSIISELDQLEKQNKRNYYKLYKPLYVNKEFPTGLLSKVVKLLEIHKLQFVICDNRIIPTTCKIKYNLKESFPPLRYYQKAANRLAVERGRGIIVKPTGTGKTMTIAKMIWELGVKTLVITPSKAITDNMIDTLVKYFGKGQVQKLTTKLPILKNINVVNIQALVKLPPHIFADIDAVFIDEFHHAAAETYQEINLNHLKNVYYRLGLTATNFRNDGADLGLEGVLSEVIYEYTIQQAIQDGFLVKPKFFITDTIAEPYFNYQAEYKEGIVNNELRNLEISDIAKEHSNDSVLILVQQVEHGELLKKLIKEAEFLHGQEKDVIRQRIMNDYRDGKVKCLIGTSVIGEGVDLPCAKILIMAGGGKAKSQIMQNIGRVLRPYPGKEEAIIYDFTDEGSNHLSEHSKERQEIYQIYES
jgi:superfamily II DNA or RNA helicase